MKVSIISDNKINTDKSGCISHVDLVQEVETLKDLGDIMLNFHVSPAVFSNNQRNLSSFQSIDYLVYDFDSGVTSFNISMNCVMERWNHLIVGSKNHLKDKNDGKGVIERFHLILPLYKPITDSFFYKHCIKKIGDSMKWKYDSAVCHCAHYLYLHSSILYCDDKINNIDVNWLKDSLHTDYIPKEEIKPICRKMIAWDKFQNTKYHQMMVDGCLRCDGNRYGLSNQIIGAMITCGLDVSTAMNYFDCFSTYGKSFTRESVEDRFNKWS